MYHNIILLGYTNEFCFYKMSTHFTEVNVTNAITEWCLKYIFSTCLLWYVKFLYCLNILGFRGNLRNYWISWESIYCTLLRRELLMVTKEFNDYLKMHNSRQLKQVNYKLVCCYKLQTWLYQLKLYKLSTH